MFEAFITLWNSMSTQERLAKIESIKKITSCKTMCEARGYAKVDVQKMIITIYQYTDEVKELIQAFKASGMDKIKIIRKDK